MIFARFVWYSILYKLFTDILELLKLSSFYYHLELLRKNPIKTLVHKN